jgi:hypothetical protein
MLQFSSRILMPEKRGKRRGVPPAKCEARISALTGRIAGSLKEVAAGAGNG